MAEFVYIVHGGIFILQARERRNVVILFVAGGILSELGGGWKSCPKLSN
jgi:hypothetical protein